MNTQISNILQLSVAERIQLVEDIWDSIIAAPEALELSDWQKQELDRRIASFAQNPDQGISWEELKEKLRKRANKSSEQVDDPGVNGSANIPV
jgi:putative addiction module component (TIGR02574 family)